jgi:predicted naringenin-chalcone synthase
MRIAAVGSALPEHYYDQETLLAAFREQWAERYHNVGRLERLHRNVLVGGRHLALPMEEYPEIETWGQANDHWIRVAQELGGKAVLGALDRAGLGVDEVDAFYFTTVTGIATPSIDARLMNRLGLPSRVKRVPIFGLGCLAGAAGIARSADYLKGHPDEVAVLLSVELCSLTLQRSDLSVENLIGSGLFGDGAAAAVLVGENRTPEGPRWAGRYRRRASRSSSRPRCRKWFSGTCAGTLTLSSQNTIWPGMTSQPGSLIPVDRKSSRPCRRRWSCRKTPSRAPGGPCERSAIFRRRRFCWCWKKPSSRRPGMAAGV